MTEPWVWNDETEECAARLVPRFRHYNRRVRITRLITQIMTELGQKTNLDMAASAASAHLSGEPKKWRKQDLRYLLDRAIAAAEDVLIR